MSAAPGAEPPRREFGLDVREAWTTSGLHGTPEPPPAFRTAAAFPGLTFDRPVDLTYERVTGRAYVLQLDGRIWSFDPAAENPRGELFGDLKQAGDALDRAYGLAFHPNFPDQRYCYVTYVQEAGRADGSRLSRFQVRDTSPPTLDPASERVVLTWLSGGHNGACVKFGPDGMLYLSTGDGGPAFPPDPLRSGQDMSNLLASVLRIDVNREQDGRGYAIPADNPFASQPEARGEIWSFGHRNPWKMSFDAKTGDLWVGDVGWEMWEMIYRVQKGGNYGWSVQEASQVVHPDRPTGPTPILPPTIQHSHIESRSITGGLVYYGKQLPELRGAYIYGDYVTGKIWAARSSANEAAAVEELADSALQIITFGVDDRGELLIVDYGGGLHRLEKAPPGADHPPFPRRLSDTGLFASTETMTPAPGVLPYSIQAQPWHDGAVAERLVAAPGEQPVGLFENQNVQTGELKGAWNFPQGSALVKTLSLSLDTAAPDRRRRLETQILHREGDNWRAYTYIWNDAQTDAELAPAEGVERVFEIRDPAAPRGRRRQTWRFASRTECLLCHTTRGGSLYGFTPEQLDRDHTYGSVVANQLRTLEHIGLLTAGAARMPALASPDDASSELGPRARAYLHLNCAHCHRRGGGGTAAMELQANLPIESTRLFARPTQGAFGLLDAAVVAPGDPYRSVLYYRMAKLGRGRMPHFGSTVVDRDGLSLIHDWIRSLEPAGDTRPTSAVAALRGRQQAAVAALSAGDAIPAATELLGSVSGALQLARAVDRGLPAETRQTVIAQGAAHADPQIRDLFEDYLPEEQRPRRLGASVDASHLLSLAGDAERGERLFFEAAGLQCRNCHQVKGRGKSLGPELTNIAQRLNREQLLESLLAPSRKIDPKYAQHTLLTADGEVHSGLLLRRTDELIELKTLKHELIRVPLSDVVRLETQQTSLMPDLLLRDLTAEQAADLLAYLESLR